MARSSGGPTLGFVTDTPLRERLAAPPDLIPPDTDEIRWRPATTDDIDAIFDCARAMDPVDHPNYVSTREEIAEDFEHSHVNPATDTMLGLDPDGRVLAWGFAVLSPGQETLVRSFLFGGVRPEARGRGLGRQLLSWQQSRGLGQLASSDKTLPGWLMVFAEETATDAARLYERFGFRIGRYFLQLTRDLADPVVEVELAAPLRLVPYAPEWTEATRVARNASFRDHWGSQPVLEEQWASFVGRSVSRPDLSFLAIAEGESGADEVAGLVISSVNEEDWEASGYSSAYVDLVGVTRAWRGKGVARALLATALSAMAGAGLEKAVLDVDLESPTGALGLYTGVGFVEDSRSLNFIREF